MPSTTETSVLTPDGMLDSLTLPGNETIDLVYNDVAKRLSSLSFSGQTIGVTYDPVTKQLAKLPGPGSEALSMTWKGGLLTDVTATGVATRKVHWDPDSELRLGNETIDGANPGLFNALARQGPRGREPPRAWRRLFARLRRHCGRPSRVPAA